MVEEFELDGKLNKRYWRATNLAGKAEKFWRIENAGSAEPELIIDGVIGWDPWDDHVTAKDFIADLKTIQEAAAIRVSINSPGGSVFDGFAIHNALQQHPAPIRVSIDPVAASIASVIAMAGDQISMPENALMMIHLPHAGVVGTADDMRSMAGALDRVTDGIMSAYRRRTVLDETEVRSMMAKETWISAAEAVQWGFADEVTGAADMAACWRHDWLDAHPPEAVKKPKTVRRDAYRKQFIDLQTARIKLRASK